MNINNLIKLCNIFNNKITKRSHNLDGFYFGTFKSSLEELINKDISDDTLHKWLDLNLPNLDFGAFGLSIDKKSINQFNKYPDKIISLESEEPDNLKVSFSKFLQSVDDIPNLYYFEGEQIRNVNPNVVNFPKHLAHYMFLFDSIASLSNIQRDGHSIFIDDGVPENIADSEFTLMFMDFIKEHKDKVNKLLYFAEKPPKFLGQGSDSVVFDIGNYVLKIFSSTELYEDTIKQLHKLYTQPEISRTETMIHDVGYIGDFNYPKTFPVYYMITEKMSHISDLPKNIEYYIDVALNLIGKNLQKNKEDWVDWINIFDSKDLNSEKRKRIINEVKSYAQHIATDVELTIDNEYEYRDLAAAKEDYIENGGLQEGWLETLVEEILIKLITKRGDLHVGNLGITKNRELRFFDSAHPDWVEGMNNPGWQDSALEENL